MKISTWETMVTCLQTLFKWKRDIIFITLILFCWPYALKWCIIESLKMKPSDLMGPWINKLHVDLTGTKHDEMRFYDQCMLNKTQEGGPTNIDFWESRDFDIGLSSLSKFLNEDLGGMTKKSKRDPNMI